MVAFCSTVNPADCFMLEVSALSIFQNKVCSPSQEKEKKYIYVYIANEEMEAATVDSR